MKIHDVEQRSDEWYALRAGKATASEFAKLVTSKGAPSKSLDKYAITLAAEAFAGGPVDAWDGNYHTERGRALEDEAIKLYEFANDVSVVPVGFITNDDETIGCSPDGLVGDDGMVEIKCLKAETHVETMLYYKKHGRIPTKYVQQTQGQMMICKREWCDLVFYHPVLPMLAIRETPDTDVRMGLVTGLKDVAEERDRVLEIMRELA